MKKFLVPAILFFLFIALTGALSFVDVRAIGPRGSKVGFATINGWGEKMIGTNMTLYTITDWMGVVPILIAFGFGMFGLAQLIKRKSLKKVDSSILALGIFYLAVMSVYIFFEFYVVNRRPVLIEGFLEASFPSSTTMLVLSVMPTAMMQLNRLIKNHWAKNIINWSLIAFMAFTVIGRILSGVHWLTDILGGILLSATLATLYFDILKAWTRQ